MIVGVTKQLKTVYLMLGKQLRHWITAIVVIMNDSDTMSVRSLASLQLNR
jgi:hypothetical protein